MGADTNDVPYLEFQSDLKRLVRVLQGFKGHVGVAVEPGEVHLHHWGATEDETTINKPL